MKKSVLESSQTPLGVQYFFLCAIFQPEIAAFVIQKNCYLNYEPCRHNQCFNYTGFLGGKKYETHGLHFADNVCTDGSFGFTFRVEYKG